MDSVAQDFHHLSARFMARVVGSPGACAGLFTYLAGTNEAEVQEADIEILTREARDLVHYTNQPSVDGAGHDVSRATVAGTNPGDRAWTLWNVYRVDWMPTQVSWYVNGASVANISFQTPQAPAALVVNMWSDGGVWTGNMTLLDEAFLQIQWIEIAYNTSGPRAGSGAAGALAKRKGSAGCRVVCGIDEDVAVTGQPVLLYNHTGMAAVGRRGEGVGARGWMPLVVVVGGGWMFRSL